jgi:hypothetical protein
MKKTLYLLLTSFTILFTSCLDTEEKITLNEDGGGTYTITMDMAKMMGMMSAFGGAEKKAEKKDTVIYFKEYADTSTRLTAEEKEILRTGKLAVNLDTEKGEMKIVMDAAFKNNDQLIYLRNNMQELIQKTGAMDKIDSKKDKPAQEDMPLMKPGASGKNPNPFKDYYEFTATPKSLVYKVKNKEAALKAMEESEDLKMMKQMAPMMGEMTFATKIVLPRAATKVEGANAKLSDDKKTVTVTTSLKEVFTNLEAMAFSVEY